jgi:thymidine kinase
MESQGHICLIYGPMFSGKSSELLRKIRRYQHARKDCLVINYMHDNRYSGEEVMSTHDR